MTKLIMDLHLFDGGEGTGDGAGAAGAGDGSQKPGAVFTYDQLNEIAASRAERAEKAALRDYFQRNGLSQQEAEQALEKFKQDREKAKPDVAAIEKERDGWKEKYEKLEQDAYLKEKGVRAEEADYVLYRAGQLVDDKTDFKKAVDKFLKENPRYVGSAYRVSPPEGGQGGSGRSGGSINDSIRRAAGR